MPRNDVLEGFHGGASRAAGSGWNASSSAASSAERNARHLHRARHDAEQDHGEDAVSKGAPALTSGATMIALP